MAIFGNDLLYTEPVISKCFTAPALGYFKMGTVGGTVTSIVAYLQISDAVGKKIKAAIYDSNKNIINNGSSDEYTVTSDSVGWVTFPFSVAPTLVADAWYYLAVWSETGNIYLYYNFQGGSGTYTPIYTQTYGTWPSPLPQLGNANVIHPGSNPAIYCTYTPSVTPDYPSDTYQSGYLTRFQKRQLVGYYRESGHLISIQTNFSGSVGTETTVSTSGTGLIIQSGACVLISGQGIEMTMELGSGAIIWRGVRVSGAVIVSGSVNAIVVSGAQVITQLIGQISGTIMVSGASISGQSINIYSGTEILSSKNLPVSLFICNSGNPLVLSSDSGGMNLLSGFVEGITLKSLASNTGDIYIGGHESGNRPYSGQGFCLSKGQKIILNVNNTGLVYAMAINSGDKISYLGKNIVI